MTSGLTLRAGVGSLDATGSNQQCLVQVIAGLTPWAVMGGRRDWKGCQVKMLKCLFWAALEHFSVFGHALQGSA